MTESDYNLWLQKVTNAGCTMRVLRTEMYFPPDQISRLYLVRKSHASNPGLSFAWFHTEGAAHGMDEELLERPWFDRHEQAAVSFLDSAIRGFPEKFPYMFLQPPDRPPDNPHIIERVMAGDIVIENSPPEAITFRALLAKAPGIAIGTLVGMKIGFDAPWLMLITVPGGILVCSSAIGISKALEKGLNKRIEDWIGGHTRDK